MTYDDAYPKEGLPSYNKNSYIFISPVFIMSFSIFYKTVPTSQPCLLQVIAMLTFLEQFQHIVGLIWGFIART